MTAPLCTATSPAPSRSTPSTSRACASPTPRPSCARYGERSAEARTRLAGTLRHPYGPTRDETLDIFPAERPDAPVFVFIHGGYWRAFSASDHSFVALGPVALGITTVVVDYALCPKVTIDEITRQCRAAVAWTLRHIGEHGGDPARVAVGGHSAGGHLSAMCLETRWDEDYGLGRDPLAAALLVSGIYDIEPLRHSYLQPTIQLDDGIVRRNSPLFGVRPCATPVLVDLGRRRERGVRAPVDLVPRRVAGRRQPLGAATRSPARITSRRSTASPIRSIRSAAGSPTAFSHRLEEVDVGAAHRQLAGVAAHAHEEPAELVAARAREVVEVDDRRPVHLDEPLGVELRRELGDRRCGSGAPRSPS